MLAAAAVEAVGDLALGRRVLLDVGVEHQQRDTADVRLPDVGAQCPLARQGQRHLGRGAVLLAQQREGEFVRIEDRVLLLLPAVPREGLAEVAVPVEEPDADEGDAEVAGRLEVVAGEDAEAAGVLRQRRGDPELGREVADGGGQVPAAVPPGARAVALLVPAGAVQIGVQALRRGAQSVQERPVGGQCGEAGGGDGTEEPYGVAVGGLPAARVDGLEQLAGLGVPGPAQIACEVAERSERFGEDGADGEPTDCLHVFHLRRGQTNQEGPTTLCAPPSHPTVVACAHS